MEKQEICPKQSLMRYFAGGIGSWIMDITHGQQEVPMSHRNTSPSRQQLSTGTFLAAIVIFTFLHSMNSQAPCVQHILLSCMSEDA